MEILRSSVRTKLLAIVLSVFSLCGIVAILLPQNISWDGSVYVGMGKFIFSHGSVGLWESLRPVGFPILLGALWKIGINPYIAGQFLALAGAVGVLVLSYKLAERIHFGAGIFTATLLAFTPLFFTYSTIPMTDIISSGFALWSVYLATSALVRKNLVLAGLLAGLAFLFRFPQGLVLVVSAAAIAYSQMHESGCSTKEWRVFAKNLAWYGLGFAIVAVPFFLANIVAYHDPLLPLKAGSAIIGRSPALYAHPLWFYFLMLYEGSALVFLGFIPVGLFVLYPKYRTLAIGAASVFLVVYLGYFTHLAHKELRYSLAFLPMAFVLAGAGFSLLLARIQKLVVTWIIFIFVLLVGAYGCFKLLVHPFKNDSIYTDVSASLTAYSKKTGSPARVLSAAPFIESKSDVAVIDTLYDDWREVLPEYEADKSKLTHVLLDTCTLEAACRIDSGCMLGRAEAIAALSQDARVAVDGVVGQCRVTLYELSSH